MKKLKQAAYLLWVFTAVLSGCKKNDIRESDNNSLKDKKEQGYPGDRLYDALGNGYDVTGRFANSESSRLQVLDIEKFVREDQNSLYQNNNVEEFFDYTIAEDISSYSSELAQKYTATAGFTKLFKAEANASFMSKDSFSTKYAHASVSKIIKQKNLRLYSTIANLRDNYLTDKFKSDLATLSASEIIQRYGTHVLIDISLGAKFDINYQTETNSTNRSESVKAGLVVNGMFKIFGMSAQIDTKKEEANSNFNQTLRYNSVGGDGTKSLIGNLTLDNSAITLSIANWQNSCSADNAALIKIGKDGLVPLEDLISSPEKSAEIKAYIRKYLADNEIKIIREQSSTNWYPNSTKPALSLGEKLYSKNRKFVFVLQSGDGNLVLYNLETGEALWATDKQGGKKVMFQTDGNLVVYGDNNRVIWASNTVFNGYDFTGSTALRFQLQDDGNFVLVHNERAVVSTGTSTSRSRHSGELRS